MPANLIITDPQSYYTHFSNVKEQFKQLPRFDINDPTTHRTDWAQRFTAVLQDSNEAAFTHHLHSAEQLLQRAGHESLAKGVQAKGFIQEIPVMRKQYFFFHSHLATAAQECRDGAKMGEIVAHLGAADVALQKICHFDGKLRSFLR
jgi:hypothetical protein